MTWILGNRHPHDGRSYRKRIGQPYYGEKLRRVLAPEPTDPSLIERLTDFYEGITPREAWIAVGLIVAAVVAAAVIAL